MIYIARKTLSWLLFLGFEFTFLGFGTSLIGQTTILMRKQGDVYFVPCKVNNLDLSFIFDTGAGDVSISLTEALFMFKNGYLNESDILGKENYTIANGDIVEGTRINIKEIEFAGIKLYSVEASIVHKLDAPLLLGQSVIRKLGRIQLDPSNNTLTVFNSSSSYNYSNNLYANNAKPFTEGTIIYNVKLESADHKEFTGIYTFTIKGTQIKKELKLNNGYQDIVVLNCGAGTVYSLQNRNGKKYAIQLKLSDLVKNQEPFTGYVIKNEENSKKSIAGYAVYKGDVNYKDGTVSPIYYSKEWRPTQAITFERFPDAKFLPMNFSYEDEQKMTMEFEVERIDLGPIENAVFRIPPDYRMISYEEYKQLSK